MSNKYELVLRGAVPSKKNRYLIGRGRMYPDPVITAFEEDFVLQVRNRKIQLGLDTAIVENVRLVVHFYQSGKSDLDNMLTSIFDVLEKAQFISNDKLITEVEAKKFTSKNTSQDYYTNLWITFS